MSVVTPSLRAAIAVPGWAKNELWRKARAVPSLDLRFADNKSLTDATTGSNLVTFTRASSGTFVGSDGVLRTAATDVPRFDHNPTTGESLGLLVEEQRTNLLLRSEEFDTTWTPTRASVTANTTLAPNGTATADSLIEDSTASASHFLSQTVTFAAGSYTFSCYLKADTRSEVRLICFDNTTTFAVYFNMSTGTVGSTAGGAAGSISLMADGWYRCSITFTAAAGTGYARVGLAVAGSQTYTGDGTSGVYLWGAQLEQSATVGEYIPTTSTINSAPRFDHNPITGESLGLLVEEQRTNLLVRSEEFDNASWQKNAVTVSANVAINPSGIQTADKIEETAVTNYFAVIQNPTGAFSTTYTWSCYAKASERNFLAINFSVSGVNGTWNLTTGVNNITGGTATAVFVGNGWWRLSATFATPASGSNVLYHIFGPSINNTISAYAGTAGSGIYIWGAQLEAGAFPTSYIPTTTAAVTRSADVASITGSAFSGWYRQDEGTVFAEGSTFNTSAASCLVSIDDTTVSNRIQLRRSPDASKLRMVSSGGAIDATLTTGTALGLNKIAAGVAVSNQNLVSNGVLATGITSITPMPTVTQARIGSGTASSVFNGTIRRLTYWPQRLANSTLQQITQ